MAASMAALEENRNVGAGENDNENEMTAKTENIIENIIRKCQCGVKA
jgi:hypothetical protein